MLFTTIKNRPVAAVECFWPVFWVLALILLMVFHVHWIVRSICKL